MTSQELLLDSKANTIVDLPGPACDKSEGAESGQDAGTQTTPIFTDIEPRSSARMSGNRSTVGKLRIPIKPESFCFKDAV